jgi:hypothetical protein
MDEKDANLQTIAVKYKHCIIVDERGRFPGGAPQGELCALCYESGLNTHLCTVSEVNKNGVVMPQSRAL